MGDTVEYERQGQIGFITFNRPEVLNAESNQLLEDFSSVLEKARDDEQVKILILRGKGKSFCAGADLKEVGRLAQKDQTYRLELVQYRVSRLLVRQVGKPTIAAIRGYALGGGLEFAMNCDIRIASEDAKFGFPEASVGAVVTSAGTQMLPRLIGTGRAMRLILSSEIIDARKAQDWGLVDEVVASEELDKTVIDLANKIANNSATAVKLLRRLIQRNASVSFEEALQSEEDCGHILFTQGETSKGMSGKYQRMKEN